MLTAGVKDPRLWYSSWISTQEPSFWTQLQSTYPKAHYYPSQHQTFPRTRNQESLFSGLCQNLLIWHSKWSAGGKTVVYKNYQLGPKANLGSNEVNGSIPTDCNVTWHRLWQLHINQSRLVTAFQLIVLSWKHTESFISPFVHSSTSKVIENYLEANAEQYRHKWLLVLYWIRKIKQEMLP